MRLIKLEISGFKSFQEKTTVVFPPGITAVVGPNGCGKSNIVDALRWVMGEQSVKQLRGKSMEDLIFAGADGKQPLNMADVSLTIENSSGQAIESPMNPYTEIMVTRRIYRSGESAYMINRQPCRLKDIHNLFLGSGSGKNSFAVIQQGNIGALTDASPEERRFFIEDAADITKFKERKKETLSRIQSTQENLLRLSDIIEELKRQIANLDRQAAKAKKFKEFRALSKDLDIRIALWYFDQYSREIRDKLLKADHLKETEKNRSQDLFDLESQLSRISREAVEQKQHMDDLEQQRFELQRHVDKKENDREHLVRESKRLDEDIRDIGEKLSDLGTRNRNLELEIEQARGSHVDIDDDLDQTEEELSKERDIQDNLKTVLKECEQTMKTLHKDHMVLAGNEAKTQSILNHAQQRKGDVSRRLKRMDEDLLDSERRLTQARKEKEQAALAVEGFQVAIRDLHLDLDRVRKDLHHQSALYDEQRKILRGLDMDHSAHTSRHSTLKTIQDQYGWYEQGVKAVMQHVADRETSPVRGLVAEMIRPQPGYEAATEAVLGESLQHILVDAPQDAVDLIHYLKENTQGNSGFVPLMGIRPPLPLPVPEGCSALIDHVDVIDHHRNLALTLLGNALVVEHLDQALTLAGLDSPSRPLVTRTGDLITEKGVILGGSQDPSTSIFGKKQELENLETAIHDIETSQGEVRRQLEHLDAEIKGLVQQEKDLSDELKYSENDKREGEKALFVSVEALKQAEKKREILYLEQEQLSGEDEDINQEITSLTQSLEAIHGDIQGIESRIEDTTDRITAITVQLETRNKTVVELQLRISSLKAKRENYHSSLKRLEEFLHEGMKRKTRLEDEIREKKERSAQITVTLANDKTELEHLARSLARVSEEHLVARNNLVAIEKSHKEKEAVKAGLLKERDRDGSRLQVLEIELSQVRLKRESLTCRIEEKYHHRINQYSLEFEENDVDITGLSPLEITGMETELKELTKKITQLGDVNLGAISEYEELKTRFDFLVEQQDDLVHSLEDLETIIKKINQVSQERFLETFNQINDKLSELFPTLFEGGSAQMILTDPASPLTTGVELMIQPPGKKLTRLSLLSGGEKALSAIAFVFSIFMIKPSSFCIMDEIDAPLDDANVTRFNNLVKHIGKQSQILMITHNKLSMEFADVLFGVTMEKKGVSKIVSVNLSGTSDTSPGTVAVA